MACVLSSSGALLAKRAISSRGGKPSDSQFLSVAERQLACAYQRVAKALLVLAISYRQLEVCFPPRKNLSLALLVRENSFLRETAAAEAFLLMRRTFDRPVIDVTPVHARRGQVRAISRINVMVHSKCKAMRWECTEARAAAS
jgi:hypothetical protein